MHADLRPGMELVREVTVEPEMAAAHLGSGGLQVLATPAMLMLIERACRSLVEPHLDAGQATVGTAAELRHLAPTPVGASVTVRVVISSIDGNLISFDAQVSDRSELVGTASHQRAVIDVERFIARVERKAHALQG